MVLAFRVETGWVVGAAETFTLTVFVDLPHTVNSAVNLLIAGVTRDVERRD